MPKVAIFGSGTGAGFIAAAVNATSNATLLGSFSRNADARAAFATQYGGTPFESAEELLASRPDLVIISSANQLRREQFQQALAAGCDVLIDKPVAITTAQVKSMVDEARQHADRFVGVLLQHTFNPAILAARRLVQSGFLGTPLTAHVKLHWGRFGAYLDRRYKRANNDGVILNQSPHALQAVLQIASETLREPLTVGAHPVDSVWCRSNAVAHAGDARCEVETTAVGMFCLINGLPITFSLTAGTNVSSKWEVSFLGTNGKFAVREDGVFIRTETAHSSLPVDDLPFEAVTPTNAPDASASAAGSGSSLHAVFLADFLRRRESDRASGLGQFIQGTWSTTLGLAMQLSAQRNEPLPVPSFVERSGLLFT